MVEAFPQTHLDIMTACEDPFNIKTFEFQGKVWPLRQTGQMVLEDELLRLGPQDGPHHPGFFCFTTSFREEVNPVPGRHYPVFGMFEFERPGDFEELLDFETELLDVLGFGRFKVNGEYPIFDYDQLADRFGVDEISHREENRLLEEDGSEVVFIQNFPNSSSPFWNMARYKCLDYDFLFEGMTDHAKKADVIIHGHETIGSAERSCDPEEMLFQFKNISNGQYAELLYEKFGKGRVQNELYRFLDHSFFPRFGGGIGMNRLCNAMVQIFK